MLLKKTRRIIWENKGDLGEKYGWFKREKYGL